MKRCSVPLLVVMISLFTAGQTVQTQPPPRAELRAQRYLYRASLVQAAPGRLLDLIDLYKQQAARAGQPPLWMRHSQGDRWDLLILEPMGGYEGYYAPQGARLLPRPGPAFENDRKNLVAWEEDVFVWGPPAEDLRKAFADAGFFHVEMFHALAGRIPDLLRERSMENAYAKAIGQPENFIFLRDQGAAWDVFTVGCFRNLKHYAASAEVPAETSAAAAKSAGFESADRIGPYLRQFISDHHDTLAVGIK